MGIKFGEIDATQILKNEFDIMVLTRIIEKLTVFNPTMRYPNNEEIAQIKRDVVENLSNKYPNSGIEYKP